MERPRWQGLIIETAGLLQTDREQADAKAQEVFEAIEKVSEPDAAILALIRFYDLLKTQYVIDNDGGHLHDPFFKHTMQVAHTLATKLDEVAPTKFPDANRPSIASTLARIGHECVKGDRMNAAIAMFENSARIHPRPNPWELTGFAETLRQNNKFEAAEAHLNTAFSVCDKGRPDELLAILNLALCSLCQNDLAKAGRYFDKLATLKNRWPKEYAKATEAYQKATQAPSQTIKFSMAAPWD